jgi:hypothetical protein
MAYVKFSRGTFTFKRDTDFCYKPGSNIVRCLAQQRQIYKEAF